MSKLKASQNINTESGTNATPRNSKKKTIVAVVVIAAVAVVVLALIFGRESESNTVVTPDNVRDVINELEDAERTPIGSYEVSMNTDWHFPSATEASSDAYVANPVNNTSTVYFTIENEDGETLYTSPYIPVGSSLEDITLEQELDEGTYDTVLTYHLVDDDYKETSNVSVSLSITIGQ